MFFSKKNGGLMDVIRCDEASYLIWKWHPTGSMSGKNKRENSIRWGSSLRVKEGSVAIFVYNRSDEYMQDVVPGPCDMILNTGNLPVLDSLIGAIYAGGSPFQAEVYFINLAQLIQVKFGVPFFDVFDPRFLDFGVPTAVRGTISFRITDYREFIKLHRLDRFDLQMFQMQIRDAVIKTVKNIVTNIPMEYGIPAVQLERKISLINELVEEDLKKQLYRNFGVTVSGVDIAAIEIEKTSEGYHQLREVTQDISVATVRAQTEAEIKKMQDLQRIEAEHLEGTLRSQREEAQYAQRIQTQSEHLAAHQINQKTAVGIAGAEALGRMGDNGTMDMGSGGLNPTAMMSGMLMGGAIGRNMAEMMDDMIGGLQSVEAAVSPQVPAMAYHIVVNGQSFGPFDHATLSQMVSMGTLIRSSLVWKPGMTNWMQAGEVEELQGLFIQESLVPPEIPL